MGDAGTSPNHQTDRHKQLLEQYKQKLREAEDATAFARDGTKSPPRASVSTIVASPRTPGTRDGTREGDAAAAVEPDVPADTVATEPEPAKRSDNGGNIGDVAPEARTNVMALHRSGKTAAQIRNHYLLVDCGLTDAAVLAIIHEGREEAKAFLRLLPALADAAVRKSFERDSPAATPHDSAPDTRQIDDPEAAMTMLRSARSIPIPSSSPTTAMADDEREREMRELSLKKVAEIQEEHAKIHEKDAKIAALRERIRVLEIQEPERTLRERVRALETQMRGQKEQMQGEIDELKLKCLRLEGQLISAAKEEDRLHQENTIVKSQLHKGFIQ